MSGEVAAVAIDGGELPLGGGLLALVRPALDALQPGAMLAVLSRSESVRMDLPSWCRSERHEYLGFEELSNGIDRHLIRRSEFSVPPPSSREQRQMPRTGKLTASDVLDAAPMPESADPFTGFAPRGARVVPGGPEYPFPLNQREHVAFPDVAKLYDQAVSAQWDATTDIHWSKVRPLDDALEMALSRS